MADEEKIHEGVEADERLAEIGVRREYLVQALAGADVEATRYQSEDDAKNASGLVRWARTVGLLRRKLHELSWTAADPQNLPLIINPSGSISIITTTGDGATGYRYKTPKTQYSKGSATKATVDTDTDIQLSIMNLLHDELAEEISQVVVAEEGQREVWCLLYHYNAFTGELRAELSRPASMESGSQISEWRERIMLGAIPLGDTT
jgi:hypothetical protein